MARSNASAALRQFVDDELVRMPLVVDQVLDGALDHMKNALPVMMPHDRTATNDLIQALMAQRQRLVDHYIRSLREQIGSDLAQRAPAAGGAAPKKLALSLVDEEEVAADVEISHTIEAIRSVAEYELRELQTFTSALVGDMDVARDHNPFRAEAHARALWTMAQALPLARGYQLTFMRHAAMALAQVLRKAYAGASSRLESQGIEPASHRTLILPSGSRRSRPSSNENSFTPDLLRIRDSMPVRQRSVMETQPIEQILDQADAQLRNLPADAEHSDHDQLRRQQRERLVESAETPVDQQVVELVSRLFDAILADRALPADVRLLLSRLQAPALRVALRDPKTLDKDMHPVWQFADRIGYLSETLPPHGNAERERVLRFTQGLIDHLVAEREQSSGLYLWALERLSKHDRQRLERRCAAADEEIVSLQHLEDRLGATHVAPTTMHGTLDVGQLDTVPAELIDTAAASKKPLPSAEQWLSERRAGDWVRMFMAGRWGNAQLLWPGERGELFLFANAATDTTWAVRRRALLTLHSENLLDVLAPRSLVKEAAKRVMRQAVGR
jgi:hypothetical protein